ncbi:MAG: hypothetical protein KDD36_12700 [Flavobacteriales bacterium]|nr:hypothetical protein [Flavobacteriales bacterium]
MAKQDKLQELIKTMTSSEKRSFKIFAKRHVIGGDQNNYVLLFDTLDKMSEYDEQKLKKELGKASKYLSAQKHNLYNLILVHLDNLHARASIQDETKRYINYARILINRGLYEQGSKQLQKGKKLATTHDLFNDLLHILDLERILALQSTPADGLANYMTEHYKEVSDMISKLQNKYEYLGLSDHIFALHKMKGGIRNEGDLEEYQQFKKTLEQGEADALSFDARRFFYGANMYYYHGIGNPEKSHEYRRKNVELFESNADRTSSMTGTLPGRVVVTAPVQPL